MELCNGSHQLPVPIFDLPEKTISLSIPVAVVIGTQVSEFYEILKKIFPPYLVALY